MLFTPKLRDRPESTLVQCEKNVGRKIFKWPYQLMGQNYGPQHKCPVFGCYVYKIQYLGRLYKTVQS